MPNTVDDLLRFLLRGVARYDDHRLSACMTSGAGLRRRAVEGSGPQRPAGPVGADDDARGRSQMERAAGLAHETSPKAKLDKLDTLLRQSFTLPQDSAHFAEMLSLPNDGRYPTLSLAPLQRRRKTLEALTAQLEALSRSNPVLMIFEDLQWVDPTSLEVLDRAVDRIKTLPVLLIVTYRPEGEARWVGRPHVTVMTLNRLGKPEIAAMIDSVTGNRSVAESVKQDIIERTDGIPLFIGK
jgi:predicted ATPase